MTGTPMPPWLLQHLRAGGGLTDDGVTRRARPRTCRKCGALILAGLDAPTVAGKALADPTPLSSRGELAALLAGRSTYDLTRGGDGRLVLDRRDNWHITGSPASNPAGIRATADVVADHACRMWWPRECVEPSRIPASSSVDLPVDPPF